MDTLFAKDISTKFQGRVVSLLYYGSRAFGKKSVTNNSDYDFTLVLDQRNKNDIFEIGKISQKYSGFDLTVHFLKDIEAIGWNNFQQGSHGSFFIYYLLTSKVLIGTNIFETKIELLDSEEVQASIQRKVMEYFWRLDHWYFHDPHDADLAKRYKKYLVRIAQDLLIYGHEMTFEDINIYSNDDFLSSFSQNKSALSSNTKSQLRELVLPSSNFQQLTHARGLLYEDFAKLVGC